MYEISLTWKNKAILIEKVQINTLHKQQVNISTNQLVNLFPLETINNGLYHDRNFVHAYN